MIKLTKFNSDVNKKGEFVLNAEIIETIEQTPDTVVTLTNGKKLIVEEKVVMNGYIFIPATSPDFNRHGTNEEVACYFVVQVDGDHEEYFEKAVDRFTKTFNVVKQTAVNRKLKNHLLNQDLIKK